MRSCAHCNEDFAGMLRVNCDVECSDFESDAPSPNCVATTLHECKVESAARITPDSSQSRLQHDLRADDRARGVTGYVNASVEDCGLSRNIVA